jgi:hypothetical protein
MATVYFGEMIQNLSQAQNASEPRVKRRFNMFALSKLSSYATVGILVVLGGYSLPARADELAQNLGPVGPNEPILTTIGSKRVIAFYEPGSGNCGLNVVMWDRADLSGGSAARVRVTLDARQMVHIDTADNKSLNLQCGKTADTLAIVDTSKLITAGAAQ